MSNEVTPEIYASYLVHVIHSCLLPAKPGVDLLIKKKLKNNKKRTSSFYFFQ